MPNLWWVNPSICSSWEIQASPNGRPFGSGQTPWPFGGGVLCSCTFGSQMVTNLVGCPRSKDYRFFSCFFFTDGLWNLNIILECTEISRSWVLNLTWTWRIFFVCLVNFIICEVSRFNIFKTFQGKFERWSWNVDPFASRYPEVGWLKLKWILLDRDIMLKDVQDDVYIDFNSNKGVPTIDTMQIFYSICCFLFFILIIPNTIMMCSEFPICL